MKNKGITLISLVITIVILIILAGVAINLSIGENGIFKRAKEAKDKYLTSAEKEQRELNELYKQLGIESLPENSKENPQEIGTEVALKDGWGTESVVYTSTKDGNEVKNLTKVATVYAISVGNGDTVPVPKDFYYVGGTLVDGVIISDNPNDRYGYNPETNNENDKNLDKTTYEYTKKLKGNQFVWIPCTKSEYKKCYTWNEIPQTNQSLGNTWGDTRTLKAELIQIEKYGGFYIARYEAGLPNGKEKTEDNNLNPDYRLNEGKPQSKAGSIPWNFIDYPHAIARAEEMYNNNYVSSGLITGTQWDVTLNNMLSKKAISASDLTDSSQWGNYKNKAVSYSGRLAEVDYNITNSNIWTLKPFGEEETGTTLYYNNGGYQYKVNILSSGASSELERYHIFDMAGNIYEWTEEISYNGGNSNSENKVVRGGCVYGSGYNSSVCSRWGHTESFCGFDFGFRTVLYIK